MQTYRHLYPQVYDFENLFLAYRAARRGKRGKEPVAEFEREQERELFQLQADLQAEQYRPGPYHSFYIHDPKRRLISAAPFRDRVVHHALINVIEPIWERRFIFDSYANRVGKGTHPCLGAGLGQPRSLRRHLGPAPGGAGPPMKESPLFSRTHDLILWLIPQTQKFPRAHRFGLGERVQDAALDFQELIIAAGKTRGPDQQARLEQADIRLAQLRHWLRVCQELDLFVLSQYEHAARLSDECGRLLGAWLKKK